ncbi:hypothetical protein BZB76_5046 [Actinomadura pelletieri DSM 43383]|uniref:Uncharacterized protein n=1 Tax=Actinomadura pelletieri DSM 43383 TaxID=1120940 RepID=A0A495QJ82_9ACTN|nr:hypothetical protein BZB76_5046 [Actinomadura pelletieri DSM 43383]
MARPSQLSRYRRLQHQANDRHLRPTGLPSRRPASVQSPRHRRRGCRRPVSRRWVGLRAGWPDRLLTREDTLQHREDDRRLGRRGQPGHCPVRLLNPPPQTRDHNRPLALRRLGCRVGCPGRRLRGYRRLQHRANDRRLEAMGLLGRRPVGVRGLRRRRRGCRRPVSRRWVGLRMGWLDRRLVREGGRQRREDDRRLGRRGQPGHCPVRLLNPPPQTRDHNRPLALRRLGCRVGCPGRRLRGYRRLQHRANDRRLEAMGLLGRRPVGVRGLRRRRRGCRRPVSRRWVGRRMGWLDRRLVREGGLQRREDDRRLGRRGQPSRCPVRLSSPPPQTRDRCLLVARRWGGCRVGWLGRLLVRVGGLQLREDARCRVGSRWPVRPLGRPGRRVGGLVRRVGTGWRRIR